jgi:hypothetical protein
MILLAMEAAADHQQPADDCGRNGKPADCLAGTHHHLMRLTECATGCGSDVTKCMIKCFEPLTTGRGSSMTTPLCLLACTTQVMSCASSCPADVVV